jgi:beta-N-acetylhexosaminidase
LKRIVFILIALLLITNLIFPFRNVIAAPDLGKTATQEKALVLLSSMTPEQKIGQLFLVNFQGNDTSKDSEIYKLINEQYVGGVVFRADNDNFGTTTDLASATQIMVQQLQMLNWQTSGTADSPAIESLSTGLSYAPLLIGISQEGDLAPFDQMINGLTPLPSAMAIGATWKTENAVAIGTILGKELHALGFNLLLGPSLDVLDSVRTDTGEDLGVRTFGGDPYWVAQMGKAFIKGVHIGGENQIMVVSKHFPGRGGSDRLPEDEVATVRKSLEQLKQIELAPFFAVTKITNDPVEQTDGLLLSHIRYQGFQGNIRAITKPISFDASSLTQLLTLPEFSPWSENGGLIVSDDLGSPAVRKFFAPLGVNFDARQVAKSALLAGNDLLYVGNILSSGDESSYITFKKTHEYFVQKYREDSVFQQRVDQAVLKILTYKYKLYPEFTLSAIQPEAKNLGLIGTSQQTTFDVAQKAATLISPSLKDLESDLPNPPQMDERVVFISNVIPQSQCKACEDQSIFLAQDLKEAVERLYGPNAGELIQSSYLSAFSYKDVKSLLDGNDPPQNLVESLESADWIIFSFTEFRKNEEDSETFKRLFSEQPKLIQDKKIVGFAFSAPYFPDATDVSKFSAYYAVYSKTPVFIEVAARILFREITPSGTLPVSVPSIGYDLINATTPDPNQIISLMVVSATEISEGSENSSTSIGQTLLFKVGDTLPLQTGVIVDHNGNAVPDGTIVRFLIDTQSTSGSVEQIETQTENGVAQANYRIPNLGLIELSVVADPAQVSQILRLEVTDSGGTVTSINPTISPTEETPKITTPVAVPTTAPQPPDNHLQGFPNISDWIFSTVTILILVLAVFGYGASRKKTKWNSLLPAFCGGGGFVSYAVTTMNIEALNQGIRSFGTLFIIGVVVAGCLLGFGVGWFLRAFFLEKRSKTP